MTNRRPYVLGGFLLALSVLVAFILVDVLATVFFAITVAYLLIPLRRWLEDRGTSRWVASVVSTIAAAIGVVVVFSPLVVILFLRLNDLVALASLIPDTLSIDLFGFFYQLTLDEAFTVGFSLLRSVARATALAAPVILIKLTLFGFLVFALLISGDSVGRTLLALVPEAYHHEATALNTRARETLFAIYVLQAATAVGTFVIAVPVFWLLGYDFVITLATIAAVLQFIPIAGPSFLLAGIAAYHLAVGDIVAAGLVIVAGGLFIAWLPDILIRPRLAKETADLPGSLYFVGFIGGLLSLGPVGIIAGPLAVALLAETVSLLREELNVEDESETPTNGQIPDDSAPPTTDGTANDS
ncbi:AI-2E family transporter [Haloferax namakaokahaiae]|uniref:AI-2E family transporter n=1 Tax=Haloferax namakaokahaiae TaxID=1748331 RepID=A0ABD5ZIG4_9EURY